MFRRHLANLMRTALLAAFAAVALSACGSTSATGASSSGPLTFVTFQPYTGSLALFGPADSATCDAAEETINTGGGVLGHKVKCQPIDSTSDAADEVPAANRMIASTSNLVAIFGPAIDPPVEPILANAHLVHFSDDGDPRLDHQTSQYFYRITPSDSAGGAVYALWAYSHGYTHAAAVFTNDSSAQTAVPSLRKTYRRLGGRFALDLTIAPDQTSYRTEVARVLQAKPDAIVTEMDAQTAATFFSEMQQLDGGKLPPIIHTSLALDTTWQKTVLHAIGPNGFKAFTVVGFTTPNSGPGYAAFHTAMLAAPQPIADRQSLLTDAYTEYYYDGLVLAALAMTEAKSTDSSKWAPLVAQIANGGPGTTEVRTYPEGVHALAKGERIHYVGAAGALSFNKWHNNAVAWTGYRYVSSGTGAGSLAPNAGTLSLQQVAQVVR